MSKVAVITGVTGDIGKAVADLLIKNGYIVCGTYNSNRETAENMVKTYGENSIYMYQVDVSDYGEVEKFYNNVYKKFHTISASIHCAGIELSKMLTMTSIEEWNKVISINLGGVYNCCKCSVKKMLTGKFGRIINVSSVSANTPLAGQSVYAASKAGVDAITKTLSKEVATFGITVNSVAPGFVEGKMAQEYRDKAEKIIPMKRFGKTEEIAKLIQFLVSEEAGYITGSVYKIDGGLGA